MDDGPFGVLCAVDGPRQHRLLYEVLDHDPDHDDIRRFLRHPRQALAARSPTVHGITTDGSALYPVPLAELFGGVPHQVCEFPILKELTKVVLRVVARIRKRLSAEVPKLPRGRPRKDQGAQRQARRAKRIEQRVSEWYEPRHLFVRHHLDVERRTRLRQVCRGQPQLRAVRGIRDEVYRLFDRRCRTDTALAKLARLRQRVRRFHRLGQTLDGLNSPNLEKALEFLDDKLLPATSNAAERSNRRVRKMQKTVYRVRTQQSLKGRLALDLQRDQQAGSRQAISEVLHKARNGRE
jgi:hypothetical protein